MAGSVQDDELAPYVLRDEDVTGVDRLGENKGFGAYGAVYKVTVKGVPCIAKRIHDILVDERVSQEDRASVQRQFRHECVLLSKLKHPNIVNFIGVHYGRDRNELSLIMERLDTDLDNFLGLAEIPLSVKISILLDVAYGLYYMHGLSPPLIHRDLTANNILLTPNLDAKVADLGASRLLPRRVFPLLKSKLSRDPGTRAYLSPEALLEKPVYDKELDVFSFGHLALYTCVQEFPVVDEPRYTDEEIAHARQGTVSILRRQKPLNRMGKTHPLHEMIVDCLRDRPEERPITKRLVELLTTLSSHHPKTTNEVIATLTASTQAKDKQLGSLTDKLQAKDQQLATLMDEVQVRDKTIANLTANMQAKDKQITTLKNELRMNEEPVTTLNASLQEELQPSQSVIGQQQQQFDLVTEELEQTKRVTRPQNAAQTLRSSAYTLKQVQLDATVEEQQEVTKQLTSDNQTRLSEVLYDDVRVKKPKKVEMTLKASQYGNVQGLTEVQEVRAHLEKELGPLRDKNVLRRPREGSDPENYTRKSTGYYCNALMESQAHQKQDTSRKNPVCQASSSLPRHSSSGTRMPRWGFRAHHTNPGPDVPLGEFKVRPAEFIHMASRPLPRSPLAEIGDSLPDHDIMDYDVIHERESPQPHDSPSSSFEESDDGYEKTDVPTNISRVPPPSRNAQQIPRTAARPLPRTPLQIPGLRSPACSVTYDYPEFRKAFGGLHKKMKLPPRNVFRKPAPLSSDPPRSHLMRRSSDTTDNIPMSSVSRKCLDDSYINWETMRDNSTASTLEELLNKPHSFDDASYINVSHSIQLPPRRRSQRQIAPAPEIAPLKRQSPVPAPRKTPKPSRSPSINRDRSLSTPPLTHNVQRVIASSPTRSPPQPMPRKPRPCLSKRPSRRKDKEVWSLPSTLSPPHSRRANTHVPSNVNVATSLPTCSFLSSQGNSRPVFAPRQNTESSDESSTPKTTAMAARPPRNLKSI